MPNAFEQLPNGWSWSRLDEVCEGVFDCPHSTPKLTEAGPFVVRTQDIITGSFRPEQAGRVSEETYNERVSRAVPNRGDLLYSREGTYFGIAAIVPEDTRLCLGQRMVLIRPKATIVDFRYLCYWLNSPIMAEYVRGFRDGSVAERLNLPTIRALPSLLPPLPEQRAIAAVLGALDDKIESNRRSSRTLEKLARAIFRAWFVDFEPVKAKAAGARSFPCMPQEVFDALPACFVDSELGPIPEGWEVQPLASICAIVGGGTPKRSHPEFWNGSIPWYSVRDAPNENEVWVTVTAENITQAGLNRSAARILPVGGTIISARGTVGKLALAGTPMAFNQSCYGLMPASGYGSYLLYFTLQHSVAELQQKTHGAVFDTITRNTFLSVQIAKPEVATSASFEEAASPILLKMLALIQETQKLIQLRDYLLPLLLSGAVRIGAEIGSQ